MANKQAFNACPQDRFDTCWLPVTVQGEACNRPCPSGRYDREVMADQFSVMPQNCRLSCSLAHAFTAVNSQVEREEMHLLPGPADDRPQFAEIGSCVPRRILLRHEHLPTPGGNCTGRCSVDPLWAGEAP